MKQLIIGIDGGTAEVFDAFDMPFWHSLRKSDVTFDVTEDLNQRGWVKMLSGLGAETTGALYMRPLFDSPGDFTISYSYKDLSRSPNFRPIWRLAEDTGARIGMMNVPTTSPAQSVNGFYVSGGGGGIMQGGMPPNIGYPEDVSKLLEDHGYIFDTRLGAQTFPSFSALTENLTQMMSARARSFVALARKHEIDFGFVAFRATTVLFFLAMSEIAQVMRMPADHQNRKSWSGPWLAMINEHMKVLDDTLALLFNELQPEHHIVTSDHSIVPWTHDVDFNGFLAEAGYSQFGSKTSTFLKSSAKLALRPKFRTQATDIPLRDILPALATVGGKIKGRPRAFSNTYVHGIYINDHERFGGPVPVSDVAAETDSIVDSFNWLALQRQLPMKAVRYRSEFSSAPCADALPDVSILQSGNTFPSVLGSHWYRKNPNFGPVTSLSGIGGMHTGQKGIKPILMTDPALAALKSDEDPTDLRLVHRLTAKLYGVA
ncbi:MULTISPECIES: alkaline phosphatase family protein [unclassified Martelella]|uniref:alkaline phosphatase family protein n=1 Tax=unclassified Martelella TaxID=2629616 RepID=UPI0025BE3768|nr:alkaline phosphatase family protein [Martelella sp.]